MKSVMKHSFSMVPPPSIPRSVFDRTHGHKTTFDAGKLIPIFVDEMMPGDTINLKMNTFARLATPIAPIMDNLHMDFQFFAVPMRLVWNNFVKMMGEQENPGDSTDYIVPQQKVTNSNGYSVGSVEDYFGIPVGKPITHSALYNRAYDLIWNTWYRDQNLQDSLVIEKGDITKTMVPDVDGFIGTRPLPRGKRHDYFTSCLPSPQKGPAVQINLGATAPVTGAGPNNSFIVGNSALNPSINLHHNLRPSTNGTSSDALLFSTTTGSPTNENLRLNGIADLSEATAVTINQLREAFQAQRMFEKDARGGSRYIEQNKIHFGVTSSDARLQRPEYLGGGSSPISINPIAQTSSTDSVTPQGNLAAFGTNSGFASIHKSFEEHTIVIGLASVRADLTYQQGLPRLFSRLTRFDFFFPTLAHLGEQPVYNKELCYTGDPTYDDAVFGYQERYAEYRYFPSKITGKFRSDVAGSLDIWHLSQQFSTDENERPVLNEEFIIENPPVERIVAVPTEPHILFDSYFRIKHARPMPTFGVPGLIDHF